MRVLIIPHHPIYGRSSDNEWKGISRHCADLKFPIPYEISSSVSERNGKGILPMCWNGLKHVCVCALQCRQGFRCTKEKFGKVASSENLP